MMRLVAFKKEETEIISLYESTKEKPLEVTGNKLLSASQEGPL